jgi:hypothetical protein
MNEGSGKDKGLHRKKYTIYQILPGAFWGGILGMLMGSSVTYAPSHVGGIDVAPILGFTFFVMLGASFGAALGLAFRKLDQTVPRDD